MGSQDTTRTSSPKALLIACAISVGALSGLHATPAHADPATSLALARSGAVNFKAKRYLLAARAFEQAYRSNPVDPRNLRYAGRAWQEVGHLERALSLLERYAQLESNPTYQQSIQPRIALLRRISVRQRAESLSLATVKFPNGKLELEAARGLERLGTKGDLQRALKLYETARLWAVNPTVQAQVSGAIERVRGKLLTMGKAGTVSGGTVSGGTVSGGTATGGAAAGRQGRGPVGGGSQQRGNLHRRDGVGSGTARTRASTSSGDSMGTVLFVAGGVLAVVGAGLAGYAYQRVGEVDDDWKATPGLTADQAVFANYDDYLSARETEATRVTIGALVGVAGVAVLGWAVYRASTAKKGSSRGVANAWWVSPEVTNQHRGIRAGMRF